MRMQPNKFILTGVIAGPGVRKDMVQRSSVAEVAVVEAMAPLAAVDI